MKNLMSLLLALAAIAAHRDWAFFQTTLDF
jgi:hypothetical protein